MHNISIFSVSMQCLLEVSLGGFQDIDILTCPHLTDLQCSNCKSLYKAQDSAGGHAVAMMP